MQYILIFSPFIFIAIALVITHKKLNLILDEENLVRQPLFWCAIVIPAFLFFYFGFFSWRSHAPQLDSSGFINFYNISKIPLLFLASSVPLAAMVANLHRTIQTEAQINETKKKNSNDVYYSHLKFFTEAFGKISPYTLGYTSFNKEITLNQTFKLYRKVFPSSNQEESHSTATNENYFIEIFSLWSDIDEKIKKHNIEYEKYLASSNKQGYPINELYLIINEIELILITICKRSFISGYAYKYSAIYSSHPNSITPNQNKILHSGFFSHDDMCDTMEYIEKTFLKIIDIIDPQCCVSHQEGLVDSTAWLQFKLYKTLDIRGYVTYMSYRQPQYLP
ncbi:hypothetical protein NFJ87_06170 [Citrobacter freundii]|uniref:hypothetical protein n=1 Tax=Citrobacter freundii TaxID=546 RepID=UPI00243313F0|nr:hypothetical protein [Citrobacter freundii]WFW92982.1 hypothetical protein NFJ87_06170 [Citrobacter freundii]